MDDDERPAPKVAWREKAEVVRYEDGLWALKIVSGGYEVLFTLPGSAHYFEPAVGFLFDRIHGMQPVAELRDLGALLKKPEDTWTADERKRAEEITASMHARRVARAEWTGEKVPTPPTK